MNLTQAIKYIKACRKTHVDVVQWFDDGGEVDQWLKDVAAGKEELDSREFHARCVKDYGKIIDYLQSIQERYEIE